MSMRRQTRRPKEVVLGQFLEGLNQAVGSCGHMIHHHQDTRWMLIRDVLEAVHKHCVKDVVDPMLKPKSHGNKMLF